MKTIELDVFERNGEFIGKKRFYTLLDKHKSLNQWWVCFKNTQEQSLGMMSNYPSDFQNQQKVCILSRPLARYCLNFTQSNLIPFALYFSVRHCIPHTWINHNDQFLYPNEEWQKDSTFQNDCLAFMLFYEKNRITSKEGVNHFIPFSESQVGAKEAFESHFMHLFLQGKIKLDSKTTESNNTLFSNEDLEQTCFIPTKKLEFSAESQAVFDAGLNLWKYYHSQEFKDSANPYNPNASLYDIKAYFQGFSDKGKMNLPQKAQDSYYKDLIGTLNATLKGLAKRIEPKVYEYGFLKE
ncbi:MAG: hypothetical protein K2N75_06760 [Helicobacter sp.]|uniref:hypothetical protein n=1 Tax=Helicobacter sp. TaxID=218 RepID=UPI0023C8E0B5|nr:hypothetical protein [Helicobacter sp.]MDE5926361.1 hypothetical protein [Helicobacter sp.]MDE7175723.1 hypothetical protein [Helicobacter sp.]